MYLTIAAPTVEFATVEGHDYTLIITNIVDGASVLVNTKADGHPALVNLTGIAQPITANTCFRFTAPARVVSVAGVDVVDDICVEIAKCPV